MLAASQGAAEGAKPTTAKMNGVEPQAYFADLPTRLVHGWPQARIDELVPWIWATARAC